MISIYKPNKSNTGHACSFNVSETGEVYLNLVKQFSWDDAKRTGSFKENAKNPEKTISIKLNEWECGGIVYAIENRSEWSAFHTFDDNKTQLSFKPWEPKPNETAFGLSIIKNSTDTFKVSFTVGEAVVVRTFLIKAINKCIVLNEQEKKNTSSQ